MFDGLLSVGLRLAEDMVLSTNRFSSTSSPEILSRIDVLGPDGERIDVPEASIGDAGHHDRSGPASELRVRSSVDIWEERSVAAGRERNDDVDLPSSRIFEEFLAASQRNKEPTNERTYGCPGVDRVNHGGTGRNGCDQTPALEIRASLMTRLESKESGSRFRRTAMAKF